MRDQKTEAIKLIRNGKLVALPTETVYGLAASIEIPSAIESIFFVKKRPFFDPLIVHVANFDQVQLIAKAFPAPLKKLAEKLWPGPLTVVLPKKEDLNPMITSSHDTVAVRWPAHTLTEEILTAVGPVAAPSANCFGRTSPTNAEHVKAEFGDQVYIVDGGACAIGIESTVVGYVDGAFEIYRPGAVTSEDISKFGKVRISESPVAPGHLKNHYQPNLPLVWMRTQQHLTEDLYHRLCAELSLDVLYPSWIALNADPLLAARQMYARLRQASEHKFANVILLVTPPTTPYASTSANLWQGIHDRLQKASTIIM